MLLGAYAADHVVQVWVNWMRQSSLWLFGLCMTVSWSLFATCTACSKNDFLPFTKAKMSSVCHRTIAAIGYIEFILDNENRFKFNDRLWKPGDDLLFAQKVFYLNWSMIKVFTKPLTKMLSNAFSIENVQGYHKIKWSKIILSIFLDSFLSMQSLESLVRLMWHVHPELIRLVLVRLTLEPF